MSEARYVSEKLGKKIFEDGSGRLEGAMGVLMFLDTVVQAVHERNGSVVSLLASHPRFFALPYDPAAAAIVRLSRLEPSRLGIHCLCLFSLGNIVVRAQALADSGIGEAAPAEMFLSSMGIFIHRIEKNGRDSWFEGPLTTSEAARRIGGGELVLAGRNWSGDASDISLEWGDVASESMFDSSEGLFLHFSGAFAGDAIAYLAKECGRDSDVLSSNSAVLYLLYRIYLALVQPGFSFSLLARTAKEPELLEGRNGEFCLAPEVANAIRTTGITVAEEHPLFEPFWSAVKFFISDPDVNHIIDAWLFSVIGTAFDPLPDSPFEGMLPVAGAASPGSDYDPTRGEIVHFAPGRILSFKEFLALRAFYVFRMVRGNGRNLDRRYWAFGYVSRDMRPSPGSPAERPECFIIDEKDHRGPEYFSEHLLAQRVAVLADALEKIAGNGIWPEGDPYDRIREEEFKVTSIMKPGESLLRPLAAGEDDREKRLERKMIVLGILAEICPVTPQVSSAMLYFDEVRTLLAPDEALSVVKRTGGCDAAAADKNCILCSPAYRIRTDEFENRFMTHYLHMETLISDYFRRVAERKTDFAEMLGRMRPAPNLRGPVPEEMHSMICGDYWACRDDCRSDAERADNLFSSFMYEWWDEKRRDITGPSPWKDREGKWG